MKLHNQTVKREEKNALNENEAMSVIKMYELDIDALKIRLRQLENEFNLEESQYRLVAEDKKEKRLKAGVNIATAGRHEANVTAAITKRDNKIEKLTDDSNKAIKTNQKLIQELKEQIKSLQEDIDVNIPEKLEKDIATATTIAQNTLNYFQPLVDRCYEEVQAVVNYPPSHFKKQAMIKEMKQSVETRTNTLLAMKAAEYQPADKLTQKDIERQRMRDQARAEDKQQQADLEARQYEMECQAAVLKKAEYAADEARAKARQAEREEELRLAREGDTSDPDAPLPPVESLPKRFLKQVKQCKPKLDSK